MNFLIKKLQNEHLVPFLLMASIIAIPISPSLKSIFMVMTIVSIFLIPTFQRRFYFILSQPCTIAAIALFSVAALACLWSDADYTDRFFSAEKYMKLLLLPILAVGFSNKKTRTMAIHAFLAASFLVCILSILKSQHVFQYKSVDPGEVFHNHIVTGYMMAFAAYLSGLFAIKSRGFKQIGYGFLATLLTYQSLFVNTGRTGYVVYFILLALLLIQNITSRRVFLSLILFGVLLAGIIFQSPSVLSTGLNRGLDNYYSYHHDNKNTSIGYRLQFHRYAQSLFVSSPWIGHGTGGFSSQFGKDQPIPAWGFKLTDPHSQYWLIASEFGLLGLVVFFYFFGTLLFLSRRLTEMKPVLLGLLIPFFIANFSDAFLSNTGIGYLFILFLALCLGELIEPLPLTKTEQTVMMGISAE